MIFLVFSLSLWLIRCWKNWEIEVFRMVISVYVGFVMMFGKNVKYLLLLMIWVMLVVFIGWNMMLDEFKF